MNEKLKKFFSFSIFEVLIIVATIICAQLFFVQRERFFAIAAMTIFSLALRFFKKFENSNFCFLLTIFFFSFWALEVKYPVIGYLFWPIDQFIGALLFFGFSKVLNFKGEKFSWALKFDRKMFYSIPIIIVPSLICLITYFYFNQEIANKWPLPQMPNWAIPFAILLIALLNGLREEIYFRFTLQNVLSEKTVSALPIICSSILFGYIHYQGGFPQGGIGVLLTSLFGILVGFQFYYFRSATLTWLTHSIADAVMFAIILLNKS